MKNWRERLYHLLEPSSDERSGLDRAYDIFMMTMIILSIIPMMFLRHRPIFHVIELVTVTIFIIDYILRWMTADLKLQRGKLSFLLYPFTFISSIRDHPRLQPRNGCHQGIPAG